MGKRIKSDFMEEKCFVPEVSDKYRNDSIYPINYVVKNSDSGIKQIDKFSVNNLDRFTKNYYPINGFGKFLWNGGYWALLALSFSLIAAFNIFHENVSVGESIALSLITNLFIMFPLYIVKAVNSERGFSFKTNDCFAKVSIVWDNESAKKIKYLNDYGHIYSNDKAKNLFILIDEQILELLSKYSLAYKKKTYQNEFVNEDDLKKVETIYANIAQLAKIQTAEREINNHSNSKIKEEMSEYLNDSLNTYDQMRDEIIVDLNSEIDYFESYQLDSDKNRIREMLD